MADQFVVGVVKLSRQYGAEYVGSVYTRFLDGHTVVFSTENERQDFADLLHREGFKFIEYGLKIRKLHV